MALSSREIEEVVQRVLEQIQAPAMTQEHSLNSKTNIPLVELSERVVTTEQIEAIMPGTAIRVPPSAVITPAAIDMLRDRNVALLRSTGDEQIDAGHNHLWIVNAATGFDSGLLVKELQRQGVSLDLQATSHLTEAIRLIVDHISGGVVRVVLLTQNIAAATCMANRSGSVRGLHATSIEEIRQACEEIAPNLLVLNPMDREKGCLANAINCFVNSKTMQPLLEYQTILAANTK